uniref:DUF4220 domain-containing protein n=1 Tax=Hordeum vulgare subsp. vulgare TaxID=112509 RepID=A0A8I6Y1E5_HORVV
MNTTGWATTVCRNCITLWINEHLNPRNTVEHVELLVIVAAVFMVVLAILSPRRRQSQSTIIRYAVEWAFLLFFPLISYTMGLMKGQIIKHELYPVWALFLAMLFGGTNEMSAQKLNEHQRFKKLYLDYLVLMFYLGAVLLIFVTTGVELPAWTHYVLLALNILLPCKSLERWYAIDLARKPSSKNGIKRLVHYMKHEHQLSTSYCPRTMQGYKYMVLIHKGRTDLGERAVTLEKIWCSNIGVLSSDSPHVCHLKDVCLSFSLFHLAVRRYFGYTCSESKLDKTRDLVLDGLLRTEQGYERAFQVIEAELAFLYDFFFTKYASIMYDYEIWYCALSVMLTFLGIAAGGWSLSVLNMHGSMLDSLLVKTTPRDILVTKIVLVALLIFHCLQIWSYCVSDWAKVSLVCKYATHPSLQGNEHVEKILLFLGSPHSHRWPWYWRNNSYWRNNLGQYSVLDSFSSIYWDRLKPRLPGAKAGKPVELSMEVKRAVAQTIKNSANGHLSNGNTALMRHGMSNELCWACQIDDEFTVTHSILVWHIATSFSEISETIIRPDEKDVYPNKNVATILSKYCTYLVAFEPKLLPGSAVETECTLDELEEDAKATLQGLISPREKYGKLGNVPNVVDAVPGETTSAQLLSKGVKLGKALEIMENQAARWDLLADFWEEMLVYIAPSDNVAAHIELLAEGGEFLTHIWALLMHAGILERPAAAATAVP